MDATTPLAFKFARRIRRRTAIALLNGCAALLAGTAATAAEPEWIWSSAYEKEQAAVGACYFRKSFELTRPATGEVQIAADDAYELFVNGRQVGAGQNWKSLDEHNISQYLTTGQNTVAVKATNKEPGAAGLVARISITPSSGPPLELVSDATWKVTIKEIALWQKTQLDDSRWLPARSFGALGVTLPWGNETLQAGAPNRFKVLPEFRVEWVLTAKDTGSLIAMTFDEFGRIIGSRENGPLVLITDKNKDGVPDTVATFCEEVKNCQGILSISGKYFVTGEGPEGTALYRLTDQDRNGKVERVETLLKFAGEGGEHGPHALALGPDGLIYIVAGNFARPEKPFDQVSPLRHYYEGDLVTPRYEDPSGHAAGIKAPGGTIIRTDTQGKAVELIAGGLQNPYDIAFNREGELLTADSDMEWDSGMSWYRPTRVNHVVPGGDFGWRSGWAKWPDYFVDGLPPTVELGRGSPAGLETYNHVMYPVRFHNALFVADWSRGRILAVRMKQHGATFKASSQVFLEGRPLNATDLAVGPDGWLYFCTGGRGTEGGIYRVVWTGHVPDAIKNVGEGLTAALRQPQLTSSWARQRIALVRQKIGAGWLPQLAGVAENASQPVEMRTRALDLLQLFGPYPPKPLLIKLAKDPQPAVRAKVAYLMGIHADAATQASLVALLADPEPNVQRLACQSLLRAGQLGSVDRLVKLLGSSDRHLAWSARLTLAQMPREQWEAVVMGEVAPRVFINGAVGLLAAQPDPEIAKAILVHCGGLMKSFLSDPDFLDLLRVMQLAYLRGNLTGDDVPELRSQLAAEYPTSDALMNRELARLLAYLQEPTAAEAFIKTLQGDAEAVDKLHVALHARFLKTGWTAPLKLELLQFFEQARTMQGGRSFAGIIEAASRDFFADLTAEERQIVLSDGAKWPHSALSALARVGAKPQRDMIEVIIKLDREIKTLAGEPARRLRIGTAAVLGASRDPDALAYLREFYENEPDRRVSVAMALAQQAEGDNWPILVQSLSIVEGAAAQEILSKLARVDRKPEEPEAYRQVILRGLILGDSGGNLAIKLLEKWTGKPRSKAGEPIAKQLAAWQAWFASTYPTEPEPALPKELAQNDWSFKELLSHISGPHASQASARRGEAVFTRAQCVRCHRFGETGESIGPDLTNVARRFQKKEILEAILYPSQVISDQYASHTVVTSDGRSFTGLVAPGGQGTTVVLLSSGEKVLLASDDIEKKSRSRTSAMPDALLAPLSLEEIADLFAYMASSPPADVAERPTTKKTTKKK